MEMRIKNTEKAVEDYNRIVRSGGSTMTKDRQRMMMEHMLSWMFDHVDSIYDYASAMKYVGYMESEVVIELIEGVGIPEDDARKIASDVFGGLVA